MPAPELIRHESRGVTLLGDPHRPSGVALAFTERTGGVSEGALSSLNLGAAVGDDPAHVAENRRRALAALGAEALEGRLVNPRQVHGDAVVVVRDGSPDAVGQAQAQAEAGADAVVCTAADVPVLLCFADCVPLVLVAPGGFAVVHSGWRGTVACIAATATSALCEATGAAAPDVLAYVGPHIGPADYEVSEDLHARFLAQFGPSVAREGRRLDLGQAVVQTLVAAGVDEGHVVCCDVSTASATDRFYSHRAEGGVTGRHGALAVLRDA